MIGHAVVRAIIQMGFPPQAFLMAAFAVELLQSSGRMLWSKATRVWQYSQVAPSSYYAPGQDFKPSSLISSAFIGRMQPKKMHSKVVGIKTLISILIINYL